MPAMLICRLYYAYDCCEKKGPEGFKINLSVPLFLATAKRVKEHPIQFDRQDNLPDATSMK